MVLLNHICPFSLYLLPLAGWSLSHFEWLDLKKNTVVFAVNCYYVNPSISTLKGDTWHFFVDLTAFLGESTGNFRSYSIMPGVSEQIPTRTAAENVSKSFGLPAVSAEDYVSAAYWKSSMQKISFLNFQNCAREKFLKFIFLHLIIMGTFSNSYYSSDIWLRLLKFSIKLVQ